MFWSFSDTFLLLVSDKTAEDRQKESATLSAAAEATAGRNMSQHKAESSSANGIMFDKSKRQSMLTEAMRRGAPDRSTVKEVHDQVCSGRNIPTPACQCATSTLVCSQRAIDFLNDFAELLQSTNERKTAASRDKQSCIFTSADASSTFRPLRVMNKTQEPTERLVR